MVNSDCECREYKHENVWLVKFNGSTSTAFKLLFTFGVDSRQIIIFLISAILALSLPIFCCVHEVSAAIQTVNSIGASQFLYCFFSPRRTKRIKYVRYLSRHVLFPKIYRWWSECSRRVFEVLFVDENMIFRRNSFRREDTFPFYFCLGSGKQWNQRKKCIISKLCGEHQISLRVGEQTDAFVLIFNFLQVYSECITSFEHTFFSIRVTNFSICFPNWSVEFAMWITKTTTDSFVAFVLEVSREKSPELEQWINEQYGHAHTANCVLYFRWTQ